MSSIFIHIFNFLTLTLQSRILIYMETDKKRERRKGFKAMSPKLQLRRIGAHIPVELGDWLFSKAEREGKSISLLLTEILETARQKDEEGKQ